MCTYMVIRQLAVPIFTFLKSVFPLDFCAIYDGVWHSLVVITLLLRHVGQSHSLSGSSGVGKNTNPWSPSVSTRNSDAFSDGTRRSTISFAADIASLC